MSNSEFSIYIHYPFCTKRCPYCDFNVHIQKHLPQEEFKNAILKEARIRSQEDLWASRKISTLFFGGGTPSLLSPAVIASLKEALNSLWEFNPETEISIEANPENLSPEILAGLVQAGVNRLSIGVQSFNNDSLAKLGRGHSAETAKQSVVWAKAAGFKNISIDLMFALPDQSLADLKEDLEQAIKLNLQHISCYNLSIESGTDFYSKKIQKRLHLPDDQESAEMMDLIINTLTRSGYLHYEISNYAKAGFECRHNKAYWERKDYLGLGPGAHSACKIRQDSGQAMRRWANRTDPDNYLADSSKATAWQETVEGKDLIFEQLFLGLRMLRGIDIESVYSALSEVNKDNLQKKLLQLQQDGFLEFNHSVLLLSPKGIFLLDSILGEIAACLRL